MRVTIVGAGIAGLSCAVEFAERGVPVEVFEQGQGFGPQSCSWFAGGMLAPWCECEHSAELIAKLGEQSLAWWTRRVPALVQRGSLVVAHGRHLSELVALSRRTTHYEWLDSTAVARLEPSLADRFPRALFFKDEAHIDPRGALRYLADRVIALGGRIHFGITCTDESQGDHLVIDCTGLAARHQLQDLRGVKGEMLLLRSNEIVLQRPVRLVDPKTSAYIVPRAEGVFMIGATMIESDDSTRMTARSVLELLSAAYALHPTFGEAEVLELGTQVRPAFPDNMPRIVWRRDRIYINGFFRHGYLLAPAFAQMAADAVLKEKGCRQVAYENHA
ncbi:glycine oxidase ThiO [Steroidobacter sp. S1-65]|uniref:D-amino-acid oxidase n=1 Tax=Steroidobacter gossypii TaxID=2805490 RepID=A0ABS1WUM7_9GAMM|nr:glycine oxidase ThiO [Steroidobacter gossypii]MBM0104663.1 glycine oxidase ThiO [Steroidobacter gossypii]